MIIGQQPKEFLLSVEGLTVSFDGFKAVNDLSFYVERKRDSRHHRPQRRRQDHGARSDLRQDQGDIRFDPFS